MRVNDECVLCELAFPFCLNCNSNECTECQWPYFVDPTSRTCVSYGIFEVAQDQIAVEESMLYFDIRVHRLFYDDEAAEQTTCDDWRGSGKYPPPRARSTPCST